MQGGCLANAREEGREEKGENMMGVEKKEYEEREEDGRGKYTDENMQEQERKKKGDVRRGEEREQEREEINGEGEEWVCPVK